MTCTLLIALILVGLCFPKADSKINHCRPNCPECHRGPECDFGGRCCSCISGEMHVEERTKGVVTVSQLSEGDVIRGIMGVKKAPTWCKVEAILSVAQGQNRTTYDGFTADHMVLDETVHRYGKKGKKKVGPIFTLNTECDAIVNSAGQVFTPISTTFCPHELTWTEYLSLIVAIRRITGLTGNFWFDLNAYHDNKTARVPDWLDMLPTICQELLHCAREEECQKFENVTENFVHEHLNREFVVVVDKAFPNLGGNIQKSVSGTVFEAVRPQGRRITDVMIFSAVGGVVVVEVIIVLAIIGYRFQVKSLTCRYAKQVNQKESNENL